MTLGKWNIFISCVWTFRLHVCVCTTERPSDLLSCSGFLTDKFRVIWILTSRFPKLSPLHYLLYNLFHVFMVLTKCEAHISLKLHFRGLSVTTQLNTATSAWQPTAGKVLHTILHQLECTHRSTQETYNLCSFIKTFTSIELSRINKQP